MVVQHLLAGFNIPQSPRTLIYACGFSPLRLNCAVIRSRVKMNILSTQLSTARSVNVFSARPPRSTGLFTSALITGRFDFTRCLVSCLAVYAQSTAQFKLCTSYKPLSKLKIKLKSKHISKR